MGVLTCFGLEHVQLELKRTDSNVKMFTIDVAEKVLENYMHGFLGFIIFFTCKLISLAKCVQYVLFTTIFIGYSAFLFHPSIYDLLSANNFDRTILKHFYLVQS